jgi:hypothetical protein
MVMDSAEKMSPCLSSTGERFSPEHERLRRYDAQRRARVAELQAERSARAAAALAATSVGQALVLGQPLLLLYAGAFLLTVAAFVHWYEEPTLRRQFGADDEADVRAVPGWWPRRTPWKDR